MTREPLQHIDIICYINLSHRKDRKKNILSQLNRLGIPKHKIIPIEAVQDLMNGHRGCAHSHILALEEAEKRGASVLIVEDDCEFIANAGEIDALFDYFFSTLRNDWDVFMLGGRVKKYERTGFNAIYRVLLADCAHAYCVHQNYISKMLVSFKTSLELMKNDLFSYQSLPHAIDARWRELQEKDRWYITRVVARQMDSYSDIEWRFRSW